MPFDHGQWHPEEAFSFLPFLAYQVRSLGVSPRVVNERKIAGWFVIQRWTASKKVVFWLVLVVIVHFQYYSLLSLRPAAEEIKFFFQHSAQTGRCVAFQFTKSTLDLQCGVDILIIKHLQSEKHALWRRYSWFESMRGSSPREWLW
jgi:hypothetical protein